MAGPVIVAPQRVSDDALKALAIGRALSGASEALFKAEQVMRQRKSDDLAKISAAAEMLGGFHKLPGPARTKIVDLLGVEGLPLDSSGAPIISPSVETQIKENNLLALQQLQIKAGLGDQDAITKLNIQQGFTEKAPNPEDIRIKEKAIDATTALAKAKQSLANIKAQELAEFRQGGLNAPSGYVKIYGTSAVIELAAAQDAGLRPGEYTELSFSQHSSIREGTKKVAQKNVRDASTAKFSTTLAEQFAEIPDLAEKVRSLKGLEESGGEIGKAMAAGIMVGLATNLGRSLPNIEFNDIAEDQYVGMFGGDRSDRLMKTFKNSFINGQAEARREIDKAETDAGRRRVGTNVTTGEAIYFEDIAGPQGDPEAVPSTQLGRDIVKSTEADIVSFFAKASQDPNVVPNQLIAQVIQQTKLDPALVRALYIKAKQQAAAEVK